MSWWRASSGELLTVLVLLAGCTTREAKPATAVLPKQVTVFFSSEVRGYLGPCGCSENMRGSIARAAFVVAEARMAGGVVHLVDCGDGLFGQLELPDDVVPQQERKAHALASAWKAMGLSLRAVGPLDDARGSAFREGLGLPELKNGGFRVLDGVAVLSAPSVAAAELLAPPARAAGARAVVAVVPLPFAVLLREASAAPSVDLLIAAASRDAFAAEESRIAGSTTRVVQLQSKGRSLLRLDVRMVGDARISWARGDQETERELHALEQRIELLRAQVNEPMLNEQLKALRKAKLEEVIGRRALLAEMPTALPDDKSVVTARFVPLESTVPKDPSVLAIEQAYDADVGLLNLAWAKEHGASCPKATTEQPGIVGSAACVSCHAAAGAVWKTTRHPRAWASLVAVGKQHHLDCAGCHVTGWKQPDGVCRIDQTAGREEVGCEACHGPGSAHVRQPLKTNITGAVGAKTCLGCHDRENSPHFDFEQYVEKVLGPGHGHPK